MKKTFGLNDVSWERLIESSSKMVDPVFFSPENQATFKLGNESTSYFKQHPEALGDSRQVLKYILPEIIEGALCPENHGKHVDLAVLLSQEIGVDPSIVNGIADAVCRTLFAMDKIHACLHPLEGPLPRCQVDYDSPSNPPNPALSQDLDRVVGMARTLAASDVLHTYLQHHKPQTTLQRFERACFKLCVQAASSDKSITVDKLGDRMAHALDVSAALVREIAKCHGFLDALMTMADAASPAAFPPLLRSLCRRAVLNFTGECVNVLNKVCPEAAGEITGNAETPDFQAFRLEQIMKHQALIFDTWKLNTDMTSLSRDLLHLARICRQFAKTPPFDVFASRTPILRLLDEIEDCFPNRIILHPIASHNVLVRANEEARMPPPPKNLGRVYRFLMKQQVTNAVLSEQGYDLSTTLKFFQEFYKRVRPPVFSSGILALRVYQLYRDVCVILGLTPEPALPEKAFFQNVSETLVPDPFTWAPAPLADRHVADAICDCRDMILAYTQTPQLPEIWVRRLLGYLCGNRTYKKDDMQNIYHHIQNELMQA